MPSCLMPAVQMNKETHVIWAVYSSDNIFVIRYSFKFFLSVTENCVNKVFKIILKT